jgi:site-specific DNA recombinase
VQRITNRPRSTIGSRRRLLEELGGSFQTKTAKTLQKAALYLRVSSEGSVESNLSIPDQERSLREFCVAEGIEVAEVYQDLGISAKSDRRPQFQRMIRAALAVPRPYDIILVHSTSRFARNAGDYMRYEQDLIRNGVTIRSLTQNFARDTGGFIAKRVSTMFDEFHSLRTSVDVRRARLHMAKEGYWPGGVVAFGYRLIPHGRGRRGAVRNRVDVNRDEAEIVRLIFRLYRLGDGGTPPLGVSGIRKYLNERGVSTRHGALWSVGAVHRMLTNPAYKGEYLFNESPGTDEISSPEPDVVVLEVPAIIAPEVFDAVQLTLESRSPRNGNPKISSSPLLLSGIAKCKCGAALTLRSGTGRKGKRYYYYHCNRKARLGSIGCGGVKIPTDTLDAIVLGTLQARVLDTGRVRDIIAGLEARESERQREKSLSLSDHKRRLENAQAVVRHLLSAGELAAGLSEEPVFKSKLEAATADIRAARKALDAAVPHDKFGEITHAKIESFCERLTALFQGHDKWKCKAYVQSLVAEVVVTDDSVQICGFDDDLYEAVAMVDPSVSIANDEESVRGYVRRWRREWDSNPR